MRNLCLVLSLCLSSLIYAQDVIVLNDGSSIISKVLEVGSTDVKYKKWSNLEGPTYAVPKTEILSINYQNGEKDSFKQVANMNPQSNMQIRDNYGSTSLYKFDDKQHLLDRAKRAESNAKTFDWLALPLGVVVGVGGAIFVDPNMIWVGLGLEVGALVVSSCLHNKAGRLEREASLYYGWNSNVVDFGNGELQASVGLLDNGRFGFIINF